MDVKKLLGMRPKTQSAADISTAIEKAREAAATARRRVSEFEAVRGTLLLNGDMNAVTAGERELVEARADAERFDLLAETLQVPLQEARTKEKASEIVALYDEAQRMSAAFVEFWRKQYPALATKIRDGGMLEKAALDSIRKLHELANSDPAAWAVAGVAVPPSPAEHIYPGDPDNGVAGVSFRVRLPHPEGKSWPQGTAPSFWPIDGREEMRG
jgi:hypothetical protein